MADPQGGNPGKSKAQSVADAINRIIQNLIIQCSRGDGVLDYFCCSVIGYGASINIGFSGQLSGRPFATTSELDAKPARVETRTQRQPDGAGGIIEAPTKFPIWFDAISSGPTPMCEALKQAYTLAETWVTRSPGGFPPIVMNLTDGESTDGDPLAAARKLTTLNVSDGNVLLFNMHLSTATGQACMFPGSSTGLIDAYARHLFEMSSLLPQSMLQQAQSMQIAVSDGSRGFVYNADIVSLIQFLEIGTKPSNLALR